VNTIELKTFRDCEQALKLPDLKQALYDDGAVLMDRVLVTLHGEEHRRRRTAEMKVFRRHFFRHFERQVIPGVFAEVMAGVESETVDLVDLGLRKDQTKLIRNGWKIVANNLDRIYDLTMNMLAFSKQRHAELEMTNLPTLLDEIVALTQKQFDSKEAVLLTDFAEDMPPVPIDAGGIHQAVLNLLSNACDAVEPGTGAVTLSCAYDAESESVRIQVRDNGMGISAQNRQRLYEPFYSTKGLKGTGLGLVVTRKIVEEHEGRIDVQSKPGEGTTFTITLPCDSDRVHAAGDTAGPQTTH